MTLEEFAVGYWEQRKTYKAELTRLWELVEATRDDLKGKVKYSRITDSFWAGSKNVRFINVDSFINSISKRYSDFVIGENLDLVRKYVVALVNHYSYKNDLEVTPEFESALRQFSLDDRRYAKFLISYGRSLLNEFKELPVGMVVNTLKNNETIRQKFLIETLKNL